MIHIRHSASGQIAQRRRRSAFLSAVWALSLLTAASISALLIPTLTLVYESGIHLNCIHLPIHSSATAPARLKHQKQGVNTLYATPHIHLDTPTLPTQEANPLLPELAIMEPEPDEQDFLETDAEALRQIPQKTVSNSPRQNPSQQGEDTYIPPAYRNCPHPPFPPTMRRHRHDRVVGVLIHINSEGTPTEVSITRPSGDATLDHHTRNWILRNWLFTPATKNSIPIAARVSTQLCYTQNG